MEADVFEWAKQFSPVCIDHMFLDGNCAICGKDPIEYAREQMRLAEIERRASITPVRIEPGHRHRVTLFMNGRHFRDVCDYCGEEVECNAVHLCYAEVLQPMKEEHG